MRKYKHTMILLIGLLLLFSAQAQFLKNASNDHESLMSNMRILQSSVSIKPSQVSSFEQVHLTFNGISQAQEVVKVELFNSLYTVQLEIIQKYADTVVVKLGRGYQGRFRGRIIFTNESYIDTSNKIDINAKIDSIYPKQGNYKGGVLLTIQGSLFGSLDSDFEVLIGEVPCAIISYSDNQIECVTQPAWKLLNQKRNIVLKRRDVVISSDTPANTEFTFVLVQQQPIINRITSSAGQVYRGSTINIEGTNLFAESLQTQLLIGTDKISFQRTETGLSFVVPQNFRNQAQELIVYVDQYGSTKPEQFQIQYNLTKIYCMNPDNTLQVSDNYAFFTAQIQGLSEQSIVSITTDDGKTLQAGFVAQNYMQINYFQMVSQIQSVNVDGQNILNSPIKLVKSNNTLYYRYKLVTHPSDSNYFQLKLIPDSKNPNMTVQNIFIRIELLKFIDEMIQEDVNTFKYKKASFNTYIDFYVSTNQGCFKFQAYQWEDQQNMILQPKMLTKNQNPKAGDIFQFDIASSSKIGQTQAYVMKVTCQNGYKQQQYYSPSVDTYYTFSSQQNGTIYSFAFPTITQRLKPQKETCDISINLINIQNYLNQQSKYQESSPFVSIFLQEPNTNPQEPFLKGIGEDIQSNSLRIFNDAVTPTRQRIYVQTFSPKVLSFYGSEQIIITGNNFFSNGNSMANITVKLLGVKCEVQSASNTQIICLSGIKDIIDPLEKTQVLIGNEEALLLDHVNYSVNLKENSKLEKYFIDGQKINVSSNYVVTLDLGKFQGENLNFQNVNVDGQLIFRSYRDLNVTFGIIEGSGLINFGTIDQRFNSNCKIVIGQQKDVKLSSYGKNIENYSYTLVNNLDAQQNYIEVQESQVQLKKGNRVLVLATTIEENNEEYVVSAVKYNKIYLSTGIRTKHQNTFETIKQQNGDSYQFNVQVPIVQLDRNIQIQGSYLEFQDVYDTRVEANRINSNIVFKSYIKLSSDYSYYFTNMTTFSVLQSSFQHQTGHTEYTNNFFISQKEQCKIILNQNGKFNNNFSTCTLEIQNNSDKSLTQQVQEIQNNVFAKSQTCLNVRYPYKLIMKNNLCLSVQYFTNFFYTHTIQSEGLAFAALDVRKALVLYQYAYQEFQNEIFSSQPQQLTNTKFLIAANSVQNANINYPALFINDIPVNYFSFFNFYGFELQGFNAKSIPIQYLDVQNSASPNFITICDFFNFKSDIQKNSTFFNDTISDPQKSLALIDRDGSLTGKTQSLLSSNIARPDLICSTNEQNLNSCSPLIGIMTINQSTVDVVVIPSGTQYIPGLTQTSNYFVTLLQQTLSFRFVKRLTGEEFIPPFIQLESRYLADSNFGFIAKYSIDTKKISSLYVKKQVQMVYKQTSLSTKELDVVNCSHGDYYVQPDGIQICIKSEQGYLYQIQIQLIAKI
ncbi:hypothetical protein ABPG74_007994 [Tetrahymena malaccensis]